MPVTTLYYKLCCDDIPGACHYKICVSSKQRLLDKITDIDR